MGYCVKYKRIYTRSNSYSFQEIMKIVSSYFRNNALVNSQHMCSELGKVYLLKNYNMS